jgi:hypothetical protein
MKPFKFFNIVEDAESIIWKTARGRHIPLLWMTSIHIKNALKCLRGSGELLIPDPYMGRSHREWISIFINELNNRNDQ